MTKQQVLFVLGSPSFKDTFNENRWDYFFSREYNADETKNHPMVVYTLLFNKNGLEKIITPDKNDILNRG